MNGVEKKKKLTKLTIEMSRIQKIKIKGSVHKK